MQESKGARCWPWSRRLARGLNCSHRQSPGLKGQGGVEEIQVFSLEEEAEVTPSPGPEPRLATEAQDGYVFQAGHEATSGLNLGSQRRVL